MEKKPKKQSLLSSDEIIDYFSKLNPINQPKALVSIPGIGWIVLDRVNYWKRNF